MCDLHCLTRQSAYMYMQCCVYWRAERFSCPLQAMGSAYLQERAQVTAELLSMAQALDAPVRPSFHISPVTFGNTYSHR